MNKDQALKQIRDLLVDQRAYSNYLRNTLIQDIVHKVCGEDGATENEDMIRALLETTLLGNNNFIEEYCESPIERIFFNALNLTAYFIAGHNFLCFVPSSKSVNEFINEVNDKLSYTRKVFQSILEQPEAKASEFIPYIKWLAETGRIEEDIRTLLCTGYCMYGIVDFQNAFHLTIQANLDNVSVNGKRIRPDLLIWLPENDQFRLVIECDGFEFHKGKDSFINDRQRDRALKAAGFEVFRFSGTELYNDPISAAIEVIEYLKKRRAEIPTLPKWELK
jgi:hypothetical protein